MVKVSVIVPIYNSEFFLERCINSIVRQTLKDIEIILIDDASTDNSYSIMQSFKSLYPERIKLIKSEINGKQGTARNKGLELATGEYIGFVDSDDWISEEMYELLYKTAQKYDSDIVDCEYARATDFDQVIEQLNSMTFEFTDTYGQRNTNELIIHPGPFCTKIYKRSFIEKYNFRFPEKVFYEDNEFLPVIVSLADRIDKVNHTLYYYNLNLNSTSHTKNSYHHFDRIQTSIGMVERFKKYNVYEEYSNAINYRFINLFYINTILTCLKNFEKPETSYQYKIKEYMSSNYPDYRKNVYFKNRTTTEHKLLTKLNDLSPKLLSILYIIAVKIGLINSQY